MKAFHFASTLTFLSLVVCIDSVNDRWEYTCPPDQVRVAINQTQPYNKTQEYCGPNTFNITVNSTFFNECCYHHDECYGTCGTTLKECDTKFDNCMEKECANETLSSFQESQCTVVRKSFINAVQLYAKYLFEDFQEDACDCQPKNSTNS
ncbi:hypothetical protein ROZALSC1DRAFT_23255 [Rozella allomycis CSF55]|uniref:Phospholipase A2 domain-containing protein n=1 Tax=Rozella allomycis (strain CSF55) TaxID=988480 RepID=A0A4P9YHE1_ROZAC|nr:hypothetical protein ROZALSC1DRAFT_23255 [Rozella allomycis CSF55]